MIENKKSFLPACTRRIMMLAMAVFALVFISGCSSADFNITGNWRITFTLEGETPGNFNIALSGSKTTGVVVWQNQQSGSYNVAGKDVNIILRIYVSATGINRLFVYEFKGQFSDENSMNGTMVALIADVPGSDDKGVWSGKRM